MKHVMTILSADVTRIDAVHVGNQRAARRCRCCCQRFLTKLFVLRKTNYASCIPFVHCRHDHLVFQWRGISR